MNILITGSNGFVGKNLAADLNQNSDFTIFEFDKETPIELLNEWIPQIDFVFHLAGVNRPENTDEFMEGNFGFTSTLLTLLKKHHSQAPVLITSSTQAMLDNPYGKSKKAGEDLIFAYGEEHNIPVYVYRLTNLFGKWSRPNYNTVVATFCHNISRGLPINISNPDASINLCYIDDVLREFKRALHGIPSKEGNYCIVPESHQTSVGELAEQIQSFKDSRDNLFVTNQKDEFSRKLYATYLSFLPTDDFAYGLTMHQDHRGYFTEFIKSPERGQVSINLAKPGITKGQHWHHSKNEKFLVVSGKGIIRFRKYGTEEIIEYPVSGDKLEVVDIPTGYTHSIVNTGDADMITVMWANEPFDPNNPDTYYEEV